MDCVQGLERLLERGAQLVEQCRLTGENGITAAQRSLDHAEERVRGRVHLIRVVCVVLAAEMTLRTDVSAQSRLAEC